MTTYDSFETISVEVGDDHVATITMNRPESLNSINQQAHRELEECFLHIGRDQSVNAVVLTGAGRGFCSGGDMRGFTGDQSPFPTVSISEGPMRILLYMLQVPQPMIAAVNGVALGVGATLALYCDVVIASDRARFGDLHVKAGMAAGDGGAAIWPLLVGLNKAKELLMTAEIIDAEEAYRLGIAQRLVPHNSLMAEAHGLAQRLASGPLMAIRWTKQALNRQLWEQTINTVGQSSMLEVVSAKHSDMEEAARAYMEKREPKFQEYMD